MTRKTFREVVEALQASAKPLRGSTKLALALDSFGIDPAAKVCLDVGASTGGFTTVLLERGARRVYAVDAGHGQLLGSLRQDARVVNLEATNVGDLDRRLVVDPIDLVTVDVSYLSLRDAVIQLTAVDFVSGAELVGLVKPMFELGRGDAPRDRPTLDEAVRVAAEGIELAGWTVRRTIVSPHRGAKGAIEGFVWARNRVG